MNIVRILAALFLAALCVVQLAVLATPGALLLAGGPTANWLALWRPLASGPAPMAALAAVAASLLLGLPAALALWRRQGWGLASGILLAPLLVPAALLGAGPGPENLLILLAGHASLGVACGTGCALVGFSGIDPGLLRAAACAGVSPLGAYRRVILPLALPGIMAGIVLSATASVASSLVALSLGTTTALTALATTGLSPVLAAAGVALLLCAAMGVVLTLLRPS